MRSDELEVDGCKDANCGYICCEFFKGKYIVMFPNEFEKAKNTNHLSVVDEDYKGGKKVYCNAENKTNCDNGYKPMNCGLYPLFPTLDDGLLKRDICPLKFGSVETHKKESVNIVSNYIDENGQETYLDFIGAIEKETIEVGYSKTGIFKLKIADATEVHSIQKSNMDGVPIDDFIQEPEIYLKTLISLGQSYGLFELGKLIGFVLCNIEDEENKLLLEIILVDKPYRNQGYSKILIDRVKDETEIVNVIVSTTNKISYLNFMKQGFVFNKLIEIYGYQRHLLSYENNSK